MMAAADYVDVVTEELVDVGIGVGIGLGIGLGFGIGLGLPLVDIVVDVRP